MVRDGGGRGKVYGERWRREGEGVWWEREEGGGRCMVRDGGGRGKVYGEENSSLCCSRSTVRCQLPL